MKSSNLSNSGGEKASDSIKKEKAVSIVGGENEKDNNEKELTENEMPDKKRGRKKYSKTVRKKPVPKRKKKDPFAEASKKYYQIILRGRE